MKSDKEKLQEYLEYKGFSKNSFYKKTGLSIGFLDSGKSFGLDKLKVIVDNYPDLNPDWLIFNEGNMIDDQVGRKKLMKPMPKLPIKDLTESSKVAQRMVPQVVTVNTEGDENVPLVRSKVAAGYVGGLAEPEFVSNLPAYRLPGLNNATYRMFEVSGNSMLPTLHPLDIVIGEFVEDIRDIRNDRVYVIITREDLVVKRCIRYEDRLIAKSDNKNQGYDDIVFDLQELQEVWYVKRRLTGQLAGQTDIYSRINNLEARMSIQETRKKH